jgi:hypothetical protein
VVALARITHDAGVQPTCAGKQLAYVLQLPLEAGEEHYLADRIGDDPDYKACHWRILARRRLIANANAR